jgi:hypothetical protein
MQIQNLLATIILAAAAPSLVVGAPAVLEARQADMVPVTLCRDQDYQNCGVFDVSRPNFKRCFNVPGDSHITPIAFEYADLILFF